MNILEPSPSTSPTFDKPARSNETTVPLLQNHGGEIPNTATELDTTHRVLIIEPNHVDKISMSSKQKMKDLEGDSINNNIKVTEDDVKGRKASVKSLGRQGWRRYMGIAYAILAVNMLSLMTTLMKKFAHIHPFNAGVWMTPSTILLNLSFILCTMKWGDKDKPIMQNILPLSKHKKYAALLLTRAVISSLISYITIMAFKYVTAADVRTVVSASVIMVYIFGWMFLGETCGIIPILVAIVALCGIGIMTRPPILTGADDFDTPTLIGIGLSFACMVMVSVQLALLRYLSAIHHSVTNMVAYVWAFCQGVVLALAFGKFEVLQPNEILGLGFAGILFALALTFLVLALQIEEAGVVALVRTSEVIFVFFWQWVIVGTLPDYISILGASLVIVGVVVVTLRKWISSLPAEQRMRRTLGFLLY